MSLKIDKKFVEALGKIPKDSSDIYDDVDATIKAIKDPYTRGYMERYMDELNEQGATGREILRYVSNLIGEVNE